MDDKVRGKIDQVTIELSYPDGNTKQRVIRGDELERLAMLAFTPQAVRDHLGKLNGHDRALRDFEHGFEAPDRGKPAMLAVYSDGTYSAECDPKSHREPDNQ